jgi:glycosyltransferase involved in cell wall biosynthesis
MLNILYIHQYFATPHGSTGTRSYEFARRWVQAGHRVTVITTTAQLTSDDVPGGDLRRRCEFEADGIRVIALPIPYSQKLGSKARILAFLCFMWRSTGTLLKLEHIDVVYTTSTPLTVVLPALARKFWCGTPYVFEVRDLWPEIPYQLGYIRSQFLYKLLRNFERYAYQFAAAVVALSPGMRDSILSLTPDKDVIVVPNCSDTELFRPDIDGCARGWEGRFVCIHIGAIGVANGLDDVVQIARILSHDPDYLFVLIGDGGERQRLMRMAEEFKLTNIQFLGALPKTELPAILASADVSLVTFAHYPILEHNSANKLFDSLAAGKPVVLNYGGWQRELLESEKAGFGCHQGDIQTFVGALIRIKNDPLLRTEMGRNARRLAESRFNRDRLAAEVLSKLESVCRHPA